MRRRKHSRKATLRRKYGLPEDTLGQNYQKDAVEFYDEFCEPEWDGATIPDSFVIRREALIDFCERRGRLPKLRKSITKEQVRCRNADLCNWRLALNKAAISGGIHKAIDWPYQVEVEVGGRLYRVMTAEKRVANGKDADALENFGRTKRRKISRLYQAIKDEHHSASELNSFYEKSQSDDALVEGIVTSVAKARVRVATSKPIKKLEKWKDS